MFYQESFEHARAEMEANPLNTVKLLFRKGDPSGAGRPAATAMTRINGGWFGPAREAPDLPRDDDVISEEDLKVYAESLARNGFFGPNAYYMNHTDNAAYAAEAVNDGYLDMPVLFLGARYDYVCECYDSTLAEPMRERCQRLTESTVYSGHWMAQERPQDVNAALVSWLATQVTDVWPGSSPSDPA
jgi:pimeloyl-ACP methyl ester carboxylesterase